MHLITRNISPFTLEISSWSFSVFLVINHSGGFHFRRICFYMLLNLKNLFFLTIYPHNTESSSTRLIKSLKLEQIFFRWKRKMSLTKVNNTIFQRARAKTLICPSWNVARKSREMNTKKFIYDYFENLFSFSRFAFFPLVFYW